MKMRVYVYKSSWGSDFICQAYDYDEATIDSRVAISGDTRISEIFEIEVPLLDDKVIAQSQVKALDAIIIEKEGKHFAEIQELKQRKQELLAITYQE